MGYPSMQFRQPRAKPEKEAATKLIKLMRKEGWYVKRLNVSAGQYSTPGFPDYYCLHKVHGQRWVETKSHDSGKLEASQLDTFAEWSKYGMGVWVLTGESDYKLLFEKPNWWKYAFRGDVK
jgi:hypothetical protein